MERFAIIAAVILRNPSLAEIEDLLKQSEFYLCVLEEISEGNIYVWPVEMASFVEMVKHLNLASAVKDRGHLSSIADARNTGLFPE